MNIGHAAEQSNLPQKTIRYYEDIDLIKPDRSDNGYRRYTDNDVHRLKFIQRARSLGLSINECRLLLSLYNDERRASAHVKAIAANKIKEIDVKIRQLRSLKATLSALADKCHGDDRPDCPIIDDLTGKNDR